MRVFLNLCAGLDRVGIRYRVNDYRHIRRSRSELACVIGKPHVLDKIAWENPILFGAAVFSHPLDDPRLLERRPVKKILVPGPWCKAMFETTWNNGRVQAWPVGIDTDLWRPADPEQKSVDVLLYDKVLWNHDQHEVTLIEPIRAELRKRRLSFRQMRYGFYLEEDLRSALAQCRTMIFLCEHETQGIAYQQALSCGVPIFAWDRGGYWQDPHYFPHRVKFGPVTSVPYWDGRCGRRFANGSEFAAGWQDFWEAANAQLFNPRAYVVENLTLEQSARRYVELANSVTR
jgi:glycosyltransferase involved in cell wall biosynthesis